MGRLLDSQIESGLVDEQSRIQRDVAAAVSKLVANTALMVQIAPYLYDKRDDINSAIDQADIDHVGQKFQEQLGYLATVMQHWQLIDQLNDPDPAVATAARSSIDTLNAGKSPLEDRYK